MENPNIQETKVKLDELGQQLVDIASGKKRTTMLTIHNGPGHMTLASVDIGWGAEPIEKQLAAHMHILSLPENFGWRQRLYDNRF